MDYTLSLTFVNTSGDIVSISNGGALDSKYAAQLTQRAVTKFTVQ